ATLSFERSSPVDPAGLGRPDSPSLRSTDSHVCLHYPRLLLGLNTVTLCLLLRRLRPTSSFIWRTLCRGTSTSHVEDEGPVGPLPDRFTGLVMTKRDVRLEWQGHSVRLTIPSPTHLGVPMINMLTAYVASQVESLRGHAK